MTPYERPHIEPTDFRDDAGREYGTRWADRDGTPPEDSYSVVSHPERFAPLHTVATALIEFLVATYDVAVDEGYDVVADLLHAPAAEDTVRAVRLTPTNPACAPLVIVLTTFPGVWLHAGVLFSDMYPSCGCDACDERWQEMADQLEEDVFAIVGGHFTEAVSKRRVPQWRYRRGFGLEKGMGQTISYKLIAADGESWRGGETAAESVPRDPLRAARTKLAALAGLNPTGNWLPWPVQR